MNFSLIKIGDRESPCWANAYQIWFKYEPGAFRPYSYLHFGYESQVDDVLLIILDIKGSSLHNGLPWTWFILINLCRLAWHLAVVSHTKITVDKWSDPMAHHPCGSNNLEKTFFFFSESQVGCTLETDGLQLLILRSCFGCLGPWGWQLNDRIPSGLPSREEAVE